MSPAIAHRGNREAGFTLLEALVAMALMGIVMGALATITAQWLPNWNRGLIRVQRNEQVAIALDRLVADVSNAVFVSANRDSAQPLFVGNELGVVLVRTALGPNSGPGLEIIRVAETGDAQGRVLVRTRAPFAPLPSGNPSLDQIVFTSPVFLVRAPLHITFSYAGIDGAWKTTWGDASGGLPAAVRLIASDATAERVLAVSTAVPIHVKAPPPEPQQQDAGGTPGSPGQAAGQTQGRGQ
jgi:general secretion pathway protein J